MNMQIFGEHDERTIQQLETCVAAEEGARGVLCADGHLGYSQPIGGVVAYREHVSPSGVGYDIGCGNKAVLTNLINQDFAEDQWPLIANEINERISFGMGRKNNEPVDHPVLDAIHDAAFAPQRQLYDLAVKQLGTVGAGNHYVDIFADEQDRIWIGVHFGSRGFGHKTASGFLALAQGKKFDERASEGEMMSPPVLLESESDLGQMYIEAMTLAGEYAYAGRDVVCNKVLEILGARTVDEVHNHHNYAWRENHAGDELWVVRKGATPAFRGQRGFVGSSMGGDSVIISGDENPVSASALYSTIHGAGRAMSRTQAAGKFVKQWVNNVRDDQGTHASQEEALAYPGATRTKKVRGRTRAGGAVDFVAVQQDLKQRGIELRGGAADEAPAAYKSLPEVLEHHAGTIKVLHTLRPLIVCMAGPDTVDPFKD
jgi:tRNA-splicing ligase RtcB (3'-phosphate/5'-hydroxy nucleic acid ligase)